MRSYEEIEKDLVRVEREKRALLREFEATYCSIQKEHAKENPALYRELTRQVPWSAKDYKERYGSLENFTEELTRRCAESVQFWDKNEDSVYADKFGKAFSFLAPLEKTALTKKVGEDELWEMIAEEAGAIYQFAIRKGL